MCPYCRRLLTVAVCTSCLLDSVAPPAVLPYMPHIEVSTSIGISVDENYIVPGGPGPLAQNIAPDLYVDPDTFFTATVGAAA